MLIDTATEAQRDTEITIKIKYFDKEIDKIEKVNIGDWIDLRAAETVKLKKGEFEEVSYAGN